MTHRNLHAFIQGKGIFFFRTSIAINLSFGRSVIIRTYFVANASWKSLPWIHEFIYVLSYLQKMNWFRCKIAPCKNELLFLSSELNRLTEISLYYFSTWSSGIKWQVNWTPTGANLKATGVDAPASASGQDVIASPLLCGVPGNPTQILVLWVFIFKD